MVKQHALPFLSVLCLALLLACGGEDQRKNIDNLVAQGDVVGAKNTFKELVETSDDPNLTRDYIQFLFEHRQYQDFRRSAREYLAKYPEDKQVKGLMFDYYAMLASNAERQKDFETALDYVVRELLNPDYVDYGKWEKRQTTILTRWFEHAKDKGDDNELRKVLVRMENLGFENLARSLAPELFDTVSNQEN
jgi:hypothetical protein